MAQLQVTLVEGKNLKKKDLFSDNDAFVEMYLDDKNQKQKSRVERNSKNPQWKQFFVLYEDFFFNEINILSILVIIFTDKILFMLLFMMKMQSKTTKSVQ
jgi:Ca2+-dependent lipid-binding protein